MSAVDRNNPSFKLFPVNNNRTAWKPVSLPIILVMPHKRDLLGNTIPNSEIISIRMYIEDIPQLAKVTGYQYRGIQFPDHELYAININNNDITDKMLELNNLTITNSSGEAVSLNDAITGDIITYTTTTGVTSTIEFIAGADYYDLSNFSINVETLQSDIYNLAYDVVYYHRQTTNDINQTFLCISDTPITSSFKFKIDHPGRVLDEFYRLTPQPYLTNNNKSQDSTLELYRPFTDIIQDVMDEQDLLERINWVFDTPPEAIPYLSALLGWDIPYFPQSLDQLRRAVLRRTVELQNLKGSKRAITNIFRLFGFEILISNLWYSSDKKLLIRPDQTLPLQYKNEQITTKTINQIDLILDAYTVTSLNPITIPLLFRPQEKVGLDDFTAIKDGGNVTISAYVVKPNSDAHIALSQLSLDIIENHATFGIDTCTEDTSNNLDPTIIANTIGDSETYGHSQLFISGKLANIAIDVLSGPIIPLTEHGLQFNRETNTLTLTLNGLNEFDGYLVYAYATYKKCEFVVPDVLHNLQSNKFDIQVLTDDLSELVDPTTLEFAIEFLYRLKAFHSQLYSISTRIELTETYEVTDLSIGGNVAQRYDVDIGKLQVPPAILPLTPENENDCLGFNPTALGYKNTDLILRSRKLNNLAEEYTAWQALDGRSDTITNSYITPTSPRGDSNGYTHVGQDKIVISNKEHTTNVINTTLEIGDNHGTPQKPHNNINATRESYATREQIPITNVNDYYYKGRVDSDIEYHITSPTTDNIKFNPITLSMGYGVYWLYPTFTKISVAGTTQPVSRSSTNKIHFTGTAHESSIEYYKKNLQYNYLSVATDIKLPNDQNSFLGRLYRDYKPGSQTLHFSNIDNSINPNQQFNLALQRPSLEISKPILHFPGCRFPRMNAITNDYVHPIYKARPWDFNQCVPITSSTIIESFLNFRIVEDELQFDTSDLITYGNGLIPDISSLGEHLFDDYSLAEQNNVIHSVYMNDATSNPAVTFNGVCDYDTLTPDGVIQTDDPIFTSHDGSSDYADGYPCVYGQIVFLTPEATIYDDALNALGLPSITSNPNLTFLLRSGILIESGLRLDGGCLLLNSEATTTRQSLCSLESYLNDDNDYDFSPDHMSVTPYLTYEDSLDVKMLTLNKSTGISINTLLETI